MFRRTGKPLSFPPDFRMDISRHRLMVVMRSIHLARCFILFSNYLFSQLFFWDHIFSTAASCLIPFIRSVLPLLLLSLVLFVVSCDGGDGTTTDTICRPGCLPRRPPDDNRHDLISLLSPFTLASPLTNPNAHLQPQPRLLPTPSKSPRTALPI
jgi:hypothetical protein